MYKELFYKNNRQAEQKRQIQELEITNNAISKGFAEVAEELGVAPQKVESILQDEDKFTQEGWKGLQEYRKAYRQMQEKRGRKKP